MNREVRRFAAQFLIVWLPFCWAAPALCQDSDSATSQGISSPPPVSPLPDTALPPSETPMETPGTSASATPAVQNAVLEGIQVSSEPSKDQPNESQVTCYFIFRDKPSSYFYEIKRKISKLVFEFNDAQKGTSPIPSQKVPPLEGFDLDQHKVDVNKDVRGLKPEWHDQVSVTFNLSAIPKIHVSDEYNVISFSFAWSTDPAKLKTLVDKSGQTNWGLVGGLAGGGVVAIGAVLYYFS